MLINIDFLLLILIFILVVLILTGFCSLCESNILAIIQISIGPALFFFGLLTPITDGLKLFLNFIVFTMSSEPIFLILLLLITTFFIFLPWFFMPLGFILMIDTSFTVLFLVLIHLMSNSFSIFFVGFAVISNNFVYISTISTLLFTILGESCTFILYLTSLSIDYMSLLSINDICIGQLYSPNIYFFGLFYIFLFWVCMLLDGQKLPFDYMECESELVAGFVTEFSGAFFVFYSVLEINHLLISTLLFASFCFGGIFICFNSLILLIIFFLIPSAIGVSMNITSAQVFIILFLFGLIFLHLLWIILFNIVVFF